MNEHFRAFCRTRTFGPKFYVAPEHFPPALWTVESLISVCAITILSLQNQHLTCNPSRSRLTFPSPPTSRRASPPEELTHNWRLFFFPSHHYDFRLCNKRLHLERPVGRAISLFSLQKNQKSKIEIGFPSLVFGSLRVHSNEFFSFHLQLPFWLMFDVL